MGNRLILFSGGDQRIDYIIANWCLGTTHVFGLGVG